MGGQANGGVPGEADSGPIPRIPLLAVTAQESILSPLDRRSEAYKHIAAQVHPPRPQQQPKRQPLLTLPNVLTFVRLVMVPIVIALWELEWRFSPITVGVIFILAALTDWLDGYLARTLKIATVFGAFLDPVADKVMVCSSLILLTTSPPAPLTRGQMLLPVCIMISREITMSALREWAAAAGGGAHKAVKVNSLGKWKTAFQMTAMSTLLVLRQPHDDLSLFLPSILTGPGTLAWLVHVAFVLLWAATVLAAWSLAIYLGNVWTHFVFPQVTKAH